MDDDPIAAEDARILQDAHRVFLRFAGVDDDGAARLFRGRKLRREPVLLYVPGRKVVMIIQPDLAQRLYLRALQQIQDGCQLFLGEILRFVGVAACRRVHEIVFSRRFGAF